MTVSRNEKRTVAPPSFVLPPTPQSKIRNNDESSHKPIQTGRFGSDIKDDSMPNLDIVHALNTDDTRETQKDE